MINQLCDTCPVGHLDDFLNTPDMTFLVNQGQSARDPSRAGGLSVVNEESAATGDETMGEGEEQKAAASRLRNPLVQSLHRRHNEEKMVVLSLHEHLRGYRDDRYLICKEAWNEQKQMYEAPDSGHYFSVDHEYLCIQDIAEMEPIAKDSRRHAGERFRKILQIELDKKFPKKETQSRWP